MNTAGINDSAGNVAVTVGGGTLNLNVASNYTGATTIDTSGTVTVTANGALGATGSGNIDLFFTRGAKQRRTCNSPAGSITLLRRT